MMTTCYRLLRRQLWLVLWLLLPAHTLGVGTGKPIFPTSTAKAAVTAAAAAPPSDDEDAIPATVHAVLQPDSKSSGSSAARLVASVREHTPATEHAVSALMYEELTYRLHRLQRLLRKQQDTGAVSDVASLRTAMAGLPLQHQHQSLLQQKQRVRAQQQAAEVPDNADTPSPGTFAGSSPPKEESLRVKKEHSQEEQQQPDEKTQREQALKKQRQDQVFLRRYLTLTASQQDIVGDPDSEEKSTAAVRRQFAGIRASRMYSSGSGGSGNKKLAGLPTSRIRRDVYTAFLRASSTSLFSVNRWLRQSALIKTRGAASESNKNKGYVLADSCVAVDFRGTLKVADAEAVADSAAAVGDETETAKLAAAAKVAAAPDQTSGATAPAATITDLVSENRYDADSNSCTCPSGWVPCSKEEALQVSYGWRQTLQRACAEEQQQQQEQQMVVRAYTKGLYSFDCDGNELSVRGTKSGATICRSAALVLCKELKPLCGVSEWSEWSTCSAPCGVGQAYRWRRPLLLVEGEAVGTSSLDSFTTCKAYHLEERRQCTFQANCPSAVSAEPCFLAFAKPSEPQVVYTRGTCLCSSGMRETAKETPGPAVPPGVSEIPLVACTAAEAAFSFSHWKADVLRYCYGALKLTDKPHKLIKYIARAASKRFGLASLGYVDCTGGFGTLEASSMATFCGSGRPMLCRRTSSSGTTAPFAVDGYGELHISALQQSVSYQHPLEQADALDASWLALLLGASLAALLLLLVYLHKRRLAAVLRKAVEPAAKASSPAIAVVTAAARKYWKRWRNIGVLLGGRSAAAVGNCYYTAKQRLESLLSLRSSNSSTHAADRVDKWNLLKGPQTYVEPMSALKKAN